MKSGNNGPKKRFRWRRLAVLLLLAALLAYGGWRWTGRDKGGAASGAATFTVARGPLEIIVLEGGSVEARNKLELVSEVQGSTKILTIVDEGYSVTPEDVANGKVLVELDSKQLLDQQVSQELAYQNSLAALTRANEQYEIQLIENESAMKAADLAVRFARMDLAKFLGEELAEKIVQEAEKAEANARLLGEKTMANTAAARAAAAPPQERGPRQGGRRNREGGAPPNGNDGAAEGGAPAPETPAPPETAADTAPEESAAAVTGEQELQIAPSIDVMSIVSLDRLGDGEARQTLRQTENELVLAAEDVSLSQTKLEGTKRLFERDFVTKTQLDGDQNAYNRKLISKESAETKKELFAKYEFPKQAEKLVSDYEEALRKLRRTERQCVSKLAQEEAGRASAEASHLLQTRKRQEIAEQIEKCVIRAQKPGLVIYGTGDSSYRSEVIEPGASVRERQVIITIPDMVALALKVKVHESVVQQVKAGQRVRIRVDAFPNAVLTGVVHQIAPLPDTANRWMNPDLKVYATTIHIDEAPDWLRPGMSAEAEILIERIEDVVQVPIQAVAVREDRQVCFVRTVLGVEQRPVETGAMGTAMVEIKSGLEAGESVLLRAPGLAAHEAAKEPKNGDAAPRENGAPAAENGGA
ncbi:MAG: HlyD family efflux transporter periplasmic adaptor subunit [Candidatus Hydrogenedentes bacterium]|nr:HlyD family efflux transporter periplasmic adaptor subunit [Candidatus Hydrogenedentota bacterium]